MSTRPRRRYKSEQRGTAAAATKAHILDAAKSLFAKRGIDQVTFAQIAETASVAVSTVYSLFKSKEGILRALMAGALFGPRFKDAQAMLSGVQDAVQLISLTAHVARAIYESESSELGLLRGASGFSPSLRKLELEFENLRLTMQEERLRRLFAQSKAKAGLTFDEAQRILWMYTSRDVYRLLVQEGGWTPKRYQEWLADTLVGALVGRSGQR